MEKSFISWGAFLVEVVAVDLTCFQNHDMIIALVEGPTPDDHFHDASSVAEKSLILLEDIHAAVEVESEAASASLPSATKILQPKDKYMISQEHFTESSPEFVPKAEQFYTGKQLLDK